jgi:hypothetical protein
VIHFGLAGVFGAPPPAAAKLPERWVKCARRVCGYVHDERTRIQGRRIGKGAIECRQLICPRCSCSDFYDATPKQAATAKAAANGETA